MDVFHTLQCLDIWYISSENIWSITSDDGKQRKFLKIHSTQQPMQVQKCRLSNHSRKCHPAKKKILSLTADKVNSFNGDSKFIPLPHLLPPTQQKTTVDAISIDFRVLVVRFCSRPHFHYFPTLRFAALACVTELETPKVSWTNFYGWFPCLWGKKSCFYVLCGTFESNLMISPWKPRKFYQLMDSWLSYF